jgi:hypothetical protein
LRQYEEAKYKNVGEYIAHYLVADCEILQQAIVELSRSFYGQLGINFLGLRKHTISSLANVAAHSFLAREKRPGVMSVNHSKYYAILKCGLRGGKEKEIVLAPNSQYFFQNTPKGYTSVHRTIAGGDADMTSYVKLLERQMLSDPALAARVASLGLGAEGYLRGLNSHLVDDPKPADYSIYTDANRKIDREREKRM